MKPYSSLIGFGFAAAAHLHQLWAISALLFCTSFAGGQSFPLLITTLQSIDSRMRGTVSSLANSVMYMGTTAGSTLAGWLYVRFHGFAVVGHIVLAATLFGLFLFLRSGLVQAAEPATLSQPPAAAPTASNG